MSALDTLITEGMLPLGEAQSLSFTAYTDPEVYAQEVARIFHDEWVFVCQTPELANPGDYFAMTLAGEPIYVMRGADDKLRAFSNICRHRGTPLLDEGFGTVTKYVTCPYHAWAYDLNGALQAIPYNKLIAVDRAHHKLHEFHVDSWNGLVFVHLGDNPAPLSERFAGMEAYCTDFPMDHFTHANSREEGIWAANWKLAMENAMESYHLFKVHEPTLEPVSPTRGAYYMAGSSEWSLTGGDLTTGKDDYYILLSMAPSFVGILSGDSLGWIAIYPEGPGTSRVRGGVIGTKRATNVGRLGRKFTDAFFLEDKLICERVQAGMQARFGTGGQLVDMERVITDFHQFVASRLGGLPATEFYEEPMEASTG